MGKEYKKRIQQHRNRKPYNKDFRNKRSHHDGHVAKSAGNGSQHRKWTSEPKVNLKEHQVGITEFITSGQGFIGIVKARFSDFHVNEIEPSGKVLQLNDLSIPQPPDDGLNVEELAAAKQEVDEEIKPEIWTRIEALARAKESDELAKETIELDVSKMDKEKRTQIHKVLKKLYEGKLVSTTINSGEGDEQKKFIKIYKPKKDRSDNRNRWTFPGEYVHFLVHKENMDTSEVAATMAGRLGLRPSQVNYCGTKDKRAKTTQKFCIKRRTPSEIVSSVKGTHNVHVGNFEFNQEVLKLGNLKGNRFRVALRHVCGEETEIEATLRDIKEHGFINYFGLQRFGNCAAIPTYEIGIALLKCDYKLASELILKPRDNDLHFMRTIRETWWKNRNSAAAAALFHTDKFIEKKLLDGLAQYGENDYASALRKIPRNMLLLYPHAFQSLIFNRIASRRIKEFGLQLIPGDLVFRDKNEQDDTTEIIAELDEEEQTDNQQESVESDGTQKESATEAESIFKRKVKTLTAEDIASGQWSLFDVVLPLPGYDITFPANEVGKLYEELLAEQGLSIEKLKHNVKTYAMAGAYRKLIIKPEQMSWEFKGYETPECTLIASDWEMLKEMKVLKDSGTEGKFKALLLDFCLPTSAYATMFLRELLKKDTSAANQAQLEQVEMMKHNESSTIPADETELVEKSTEKRKQAEKDESECIDNGIDSKKAKFCEAKEEQ